MFKKVVPDNNFFKTKVIFNKFYGFSLMNTEKLDCFLQNRNNRN